uniref:Uncharacterized protein n=1 Tax=Daphnia magna TaxID=35525 RepID=A0A0N8CVT6_9CRUS
MTAQDQRHHKSAKWENQNNSIRRDSSTFGIHFSSLRSAVCFSQTICLFVYV